MFSAVKITKHRLLLTIASIVIVAGIMYFWLNSPQMKLRQHLGLKSLRGIENIHYECDNSDKGFPAYYIQFDYADEACLEKIIDHLSLEELDFFFYAGSNPPAWWPEEIKETSGDPEKDKLVRRALRKSGDLITYRFNEYTNAPSNKAYLIEFFHYPKKRQVFYIKRWVRVVTP